MPESERETKTKLAILTGVVIFAVAILFFTPRFLTRWNDDGVTVANALSMAEKQYGIKLAFPEGWFAEDCSPESKRYLGHIRYVCKWSSSPYGGNGAKTKFYLFVSNTNDALTPDELNQFIRERQEYGWAGELKRHPELSLTFDQTLDPVAYNGWSGIRIDDAAIDEKTKDLYLLASIVVPFKTPYVSGVFEIHHPHESTVSGLYSAADVLQYVTIGNQ